ncbi:MAG TPA: deoxyribose-phosphate aldolase [bacterium]|nr:deoxyribose-phosphate aldolase [bacterium]
MTDAFEPERFFPRDLFERITDTRITRPEVVAEEAAGRRRRPKLTRDGRLTILAADHPARMVVGVGDDPLAMGSRWKLLARILRVVTAGEFDGVMTTPDILEELLIVNRLDRELGGPGFLDHKVLIGCMNRGGLSGAAFEMDDRMTAFTPERLAQLRLDGAKVMFRLEVRERESLDAMMYCVEAINACHARGIPVFLEALMVEHTDGKYKTLKNAEALIKVVGVAAGLGASTALTWLKIPYCEGYERVAEATTFPILMLGGESRGDPTGIFQEFAAGMRAGSTVRGALVGRNVTFPGKEDPLAVALAVDGIVHRGFTAEQAAAHLREVRGRGMDRFTRLLAA